MRSAARTTRGSGLSGIGAVLRSGAVMTVCGPFGSIGGRRKGLGWQRDDPGGSRTGSGGPRRMIGPSTRPCQGRLARSSRPPGAPFGAPLEHGSVCGISVVGQEVTSWVLRSFGERAGPIGFVARRRPTGLRGGEKGGRTPDLGTRGPGALPVRVCWGKVTGVVWVAWVRGSAPSLPDSALRCASGAPLGAPVGAPLRAEGIGWLFLRGNRLRRFGAGRLENVRGGLGSLRQGRLPTARNLNRGLSKTTRLSWVRFVQARKGMRINGMIAWVIELVYGGACRGTGRRSGIQAHGWESRRCHGCKSG